MQLPRSTVPWERTLRFASCGACGARQRLVMLRLGAESCCKQAGGRIGRIAAWRGGCTAPAGVCSNGGATRAACARVCRFQRSARPLLGRWVVRRAELAAKEPQGGAKLYGI